jgi:hypothetical protein
VYEVVSVNEHEVVLFLLEEGEPVEETEPGGLVFLLDFEVNFGEVFSAELLHLLLTHHHLYFQVQDWNVAQLSLDVLSVVFWEQR